MGDEQRVSWQEVLAQSRDDFEAGTDFTLAVTFDPLVDACLLINTRSSSTNALSFSSARIWSASGCGQAARGRSSEFRCANLPIKLETIMGRDIEDLRDTLCEARDDDSRFDLLDRGLVAGLLRKRAWRF